MKPITFIDGKLVPHAKAVISVFDNALLYAEGLFETCLAIDDHLLFADLHMRRLREGSKLIGLKLPVSEKQILTWMQTAAKKHPSRITKVRLTVTSGESARWMGKPGKPKVIISVAEHTIPTKPFKLLLSPFQVDSRSVFRQIKTISYAIQATAFKQAVRQKCDDALLLNDRYNIAEVTSANIFWVKRGKLYTPPISAGCLDGVTRKVVLREAAKLHIPVHEANGTVPELLRADEVFISSSLKLVVPVASLRMSSKTVPCRHGAITEKLIERFRQLAGL